MVTGRIRKNTALEGTLILTGERIPGMHTGRQEGGYMKKELKQIKILEAAEEIISKKGFENTKISDISAKAGVADAVIYQFYKGKEDVLFAIPQIRLQQALRQLNEQLEGITDAESQLSKMIHFQLKYNDRYAGYTRILLFECRSSQDFYKSEAYIHIREYSKILMMILKKGISDGKFRSDLNIHLMRDIIFGLLDFEAISCLALHEISEALIDHSDIMDILFPMIRKQDHASDDSATGKENRVLDAAEKVFADKGFLKAKISDIAKLANVSDGSIYEYFESKEDLLFSIPRRHFKKYADKLKDAFDISEYDRRLRRVINYTFLYFLRNPDFLKVFILNLQLNYHFYLSESYAEYRSYMDFFDTIINKGKKQGTFRNDMNTRVVRNMFLGAFNHMNLRWLILGEAADRLQEVDSLSYLLSLAIMPNTTARDL